jgi:DNA-binding NtrC family response regulator
MAKVMVVEDDDYVREALAELLRMWGYEADTASDGLEALGKIAHSRPRVVISDLRMARMGGTELLKILGRKTPQIPCIVITADETPETFAEVMELGVVDFLAKPMNLERLRQDLRQCLSAPN